MENVELTLNGANINLTLPTIEEKVNNLILNKKGIKKSINPELEENKDGDRYITACISKKQCDTDCELLLGLNFDIYNKNPVLLLNHNLEGESVGICKKIWETDTGTYASFYFPPKPDSFEGEWCPDLYLNKIKSKLMTGFSISGIPLNERKPTEEEKKKYSNPLFPLKKIIEPVYVYEISLVNVPANSDSVAILPNTDNKTKSIKQSNKVKLVIFV